MAPFTTSGFLPASAATFLYCSASRCIHTVRWVCYSIFSFVSASLSIIRHPLTSCDNLCNALTFRDILEILWHSLTYSEILWRPLSSSDGLRKPLTSSVIRFHSPAFIYSVRNWPQFFGPFFQAVFLWSFPRISGTLWNFSVATFMPTRPPPFSVVSDVNLEFTSLLLHSLASAWYLSAFQRTFRNLTKNFKIPFLYSTLKNISRYL